MKKRRWIGFYLAIALGLAAGLGFGWLVNPPPVANTTISSLRYDYQADYVLMVAESYPAAEDVPAAIEKLKQLNQHDPVKAVQQALISAQELGYSETDLRTIAELEKRLSVVGIENE